MFERLRRFSNLAVGSGLSFSSASFLGGDLFAFHVSLGGLYCNVPLMAAGILFTLIGLEPRAVAMYIEAKRKVNQQS